MYSYIVMYLAQCSSLLTSNMDVIGYTLYGISYTIVVSVAVSNFAFNSTIRVRNHLSPRGWLTAWNYRYLTFHLFRTFTSQWIKQNEFNEFSTFGDSKFLKNNFGTKRVQYWIWKYFRKRKFMKCWLNQVDNGRFPLA